MTTTREAILTALFALVDGDSFFPSEADGDSALTLDEPEPSGWRVLNVGGVDMLDAAAVNDAPEPEETAELLGADFDGAAQVSELTLDVSLIYLVACDDRAARRARRDAAAPQIEALIAADRTLGLGPEVYARITAAGRDDNLPIEAAAVVASLTATVSVDYTAATPAG